MGKGKRLPDGSLDFRTLDDPGPPPARFVVSEQLAEPAARAGAPAANWIVDFPMTRPNWARRLMVWLFFGARYRRF